MNNFMPYSYQNFGYQTPTRQLGVQPQYQMPNQIPLQQPQMAQMQAQPQMQQQTMQQPIQQPMQQSMTFDTPIQYVVYATLKEAEAYILAPNTKGLFIDKSNGMIYEKVCGADGQSFISHYQKVDLNDKNEIKDNGNNEITIEYATKTDLENFITVEEYENLKQELKGLQGQIKGLKLEPEKVVNKSTKAKNELKTEIKKDNAE